MQEVDFTYSFFDRRDSTPTNHPLAGTPLCRSDVLRATQRVCRASSGDLARRRVEVPVETREGHLRLGLDPYQRFAKRMLDIVLCIVLLPLSIPVFLIVAPLVALTSRGPVFFRQLRVGYEGRPFYVFKFRTMAVDAEDRLQQDDELRSLYDDNDCKIPAERDPRVTKIGRGLRTSSLDELPQLLNVLRGEMSFVGPRPVLPVEMSCYGEVAAAYEACRPGLTGAWQVGGRSEVAFPARAHLDIENLRNWSLHKDLLILIKTVRCVLNRTGAN